MLILLYLLMQSSLYDCYPTSITIVLRQMGARVAYDEVLSQAQAAEVGYYADPTFTQQWGFQSWMGYGTLWQVQAELAEGDPVIWCQNRPAIGHCVVVYGLDKENIYVHDPQLGAQVIPLDEIAAYRYPDGYWINTFEGGAQPQKPAAIYHKMQVSR